MEIMELNGNKKISWADVDAVIFDMDGTLWNATNSYKEVWNETFRQLGVDCVIQTEELFGYMGQPLHVIQENLAKKHNIHVDNDEFLRLLNVNENAMMGVLGGTLFPGVREGIESLSKYIDLFMVSNCGDQGLHNFLRFNNLGNYVKDTRAFGENHLNKADNIRLLIDKYGLKNALYMGDTQLDCDETHKAGIPFVYATYGFGKCEGYDKSVDSFTELVNLIEDNKNI